MKNASQGCFETPEDFIAENNGVEWLIFNEVSVTIL